MNVAVLYLITMSAWLEQTDLCPSITLEYLVHTNTQSVMFCGATVRFSTVQLIFLTVVHQKLDRRYLQNNNLTGEIPAFLGNAFPNLTRL